MLFTVRTLHHAPKASTGPDGISARLLRECADELAQSITELFKMSLLKFLVARNQPSFWYRRKVT